MLCYFHYSQPLEKELTWQNRPSSHSSSNKHLLSPCLPYQRYDWFDCFSTKGGINKWGRKCGNRWGERSVPILREFKNLVLLQRVFKYENCPSVSYILATYKRPTSIGRELLSRRSSGVEKHLETTTGLKVGIIQVLYIWLNIWCFPCKRNKLK
jgi:hypothetical protein